MPLVAIALVLGSLLPAGFPAFGLLAAAMPASSEAAAIAAGASATNELTAGPGEG